MASFGKEEGYAGDGAGGGGAEENASAYGDEI